MPRTKAATNKDLDLDIAHEPLWHVLLFNCDCHTYDDVVLALQKAIGCTVEQAMQYALVAEQFGCVSIFTGSHSECEQVAEPLVAAGLRVRIEEV
ncbi:ATP-dependent Clp protease adaptor ClpS [Candidatus Nomurabacteria bacterium]|nr:ATP-dependent Clp protease adaptor ClpS [Candidatus Nomurabacteria bacterium]